MARQGFKFKIFLLVFIAIAVSTVSFSAIVFSYYYRNSLQEINSSVALALEQNSHTTQDFLQDVIDKSTDILFNDNLSGYTYSTASNASNPQYTEMAYKIRKEADRIKQSSPLIDSIYVCFNNNAKIITSDGLYSTDEFYEKTYVEKVRKKLEADRTHSYLTDIRKYDYVKNQIYKQDHTGNVISIVRPFYNAYLQGFVIINIRNDKLFYPIGLHNASGSKAESSFLVLDRAGAVISPEPRDNEIVKPIIKSFLSTPRTRQSYYTESIAGERYLIICSKPSPFGWTHLIYISYAFIYKNIYVFRNTLIVMSIFIIVLGCIAANFAASSLYRPIKVLYHMVNGSKGPASPVKSGNEFDIITADVRKILTENSEIRNMLHRNLDMLKEVFLKELLMGKVQDESLFKEKCLELQIELNRDCFSVFILSINQWNSFSEKYTTIEQSMIKFSILDNAVRTQQDGFIGLYIICEPERIILLHNFFHDQCMDDPIRYQKGIAEEIQRQIKSSLCLSTTISIGTIATGFREIGQSYASAIESINYKYILGSESIIDYSKIQDCHGISSHLVYPFDQEKLLLLYITNSNTNKACETIDSIMAYLATNSSSYKNIQQCTLQLFSSIMRYLAENNIPSGVIFGDTDLLSQMNTNETLNETSIFLKQLVGKIIDYHTARRKNRSKSFAENVVDYIDTHYNKDINLEIAADYYNVSRQHLSKTFQQHTGVQFNDYLNSVRLEKSLELLKNDNLKLKDICEMVGINSPQYFIRLFRTKYLMTPTEYRRNQTLTMGP